MVLFGYSIKLSSKRLVSKLSEVDFNQVKRKENI